MVNSGKFILHGVKFTSLRKREENVCELPGKGSSQETLWIMTAAKDLHQYLLIQRGR